MLLVLYLKTSLNQDRVDFLWRYLLKDLHFELIFVKDVRSESRLILLQVYVQLLVQHHLLKGLSFLH